jgi:hypothetical protein
MLKVSHRKPVALRLRPDFGPARPWSLRSNTLKATGIQRDSN